MNTLTLIGIVLYIVIGLGFAIFVLGMQRQLDESEDMKQALIGGAFWPIILVALIFDFTLTPRR